MQSSKLDAKNDLKYRCYRLSVQVIKFSETLPNTRTYWIILDQLVRSVTSVGANIIEAKASSSRRDFIKFFEIALKSANESKYWLGLLRDATKADKYTVEDILKEVGEVSNMLGSSVLTLKKKK